jgi:hypothetical protein
VTAMSGTESSVLFSGADRRLSMGMDQEAFERSLLTAILFEPRLIMPDAYFFNSPLVMRHVSRSPGPSLLELALQDGALTPAVRDADVGSFEDMRKNLVTNRVYGLLRTEDLEQLSSLLRNAGRNAGDWIPWPERMAESYANLLRKVLQTDEAPSFGNVGIDRETWRRTARLRFDALDDAIGLERDYGVRRSEVIRSAARKMGLPEGDFARLPSEKALLSAVSDDRRREDLAAYFRWLDVLYIANQADRFGVRSSITSNDQSALAVMAAAIHTPSIQADTEAVHSPVRLNELTVRMPSIRALSRLPGQKIMELRRSGVEWRSGLDAYFADPTPTNGTRVELALEAFGKEARRTTGREAIRDFGITCRERAEIAGIGVGLASAVAEPVTGGVLFSAGVASFAIVRYLKMRRTETVSNPLRVMPPTAP